MYTQGDGAMQSLLPPFAMARHLMHSVSELLPLAHFAITATHSIAACIFLLMWCTLDMVTVCDARFARLFPLAVCLFVHQTAEVGSGMHAYCRRVTVLWHCRNLQGYGLEGPLAKGLNGLASLVNL